MGLHTRDHGRSTVTDAIHKSSVDIFLKTTDGFSKNTDGFLKNTDGFSKTIDGFTRSRFTAQEHAFTVPVHTYPLHRSHNRAPHGPSHTAQLKGPRGHTLLAVMRCT